jgi:hypothetical protein
MASNNKNLGVFILGALLCAAAVKFFSLSKTQKQNALQLAKNGLQNIFNKIQKSV